MIEHPFKIECPVFKYTPKSEFEKNERWEFRFSNGWGASVISGEWAYSTAEKPYEIGLLRKCEDDRGEMNLVYAHDFDDVIGYLDVYEATELLEKIARYPND